MQKPEQIEIQVKAEIAKNDYELLTKPGVTGYYEGIEVVQAFLINISTNEIINYFTIFIFNENGVKTKFKYLFKTPKKINSKYKLGILKKSLNLVEGQFIFENLLNGKLSLLGKEIKVSDGFVVLPKQFVPNYWDGSQPLINNILKSNYWGGNYIIEFFDEIKDIANVLNRKEIDFVNKEIAHCTDISIDIEKVYDRIGNIIFQFPINFMNVTTGLENDDNTIKVGVYKHPKMESDIDINVLAKTSFDKLITGFKQVQVSSSSQEIKLRIGDSRSIETLVTNAKNSIIYHHALSNYMKRIHFNSNFSSQHSEPRIIKNDDGTVTNISLAISQPSHIGARREREYTDYISSRVIEDQIIKNSNDYRVFNNEMEEAYRYIRQKIGNYSSAIKEICLWDPYLSSKDILKTLYYENTGIPFKCITSAFGLKNIWSKDIENKIKKPRVEYFKKSIHYFFLMITGKKEKKNINIEKIKKTQRQTLLELSNNLGVSLEFRCQFGPHGFQFHDRFIIFVPKDDFALPIVFSLGTSVNSLGEKHHIVQKITNPRVILKDFNKLWDELIHPDCLIIKMP